jgi:hypothetical protein
MHTKFFIQAPDFDGPVPRTRFTFACQQQNKAGVKAALRLNEGFFLTLTQVTEATVKGATGPSSAPRRPRAPVPAA